MSEVKHGNLVDRSYRVVLTRWWGLGILSLAEVAPRWPLAFPEKRALGVAACEQDNAALLAAPRREDRFPYRGESLGGVQGVPIARSTPGPPVTLTHP